MLAIRAERAFDGERLVRGGVVVLLDEGRIVAVGRDAMAVPADARVAGFPDATVLPGLVTPTSTSAVTAARVPSTGSPGTTTRGWPG